MSGETGKTLSEVIDEQTAQPTEEAQPAAEQPRGEEPTESAQPESEEELSDIDKLTARLTNLEGDFQKSKEQNIRLGAQNELLREQLEKDVVKLAQPKPQQEEVVVDDGFRAVSEEEYDAMTPSQRKFYDRQEQSHVERVRLAKEKVNEQASMESDPVAAQARADVRSLEIQHGEVFEKVRPIMQAMVAKDERDGKIAGKRIVDYFEPALNAAKAMGWIETPAEKAKGIPGDVPPPPVVNDRVTVRPQKIVSERPTQAGTTAPRSNMTLEEALDMSMQKVYGTTGR